ncbi:ImmA/IrrE family metallo-endopeptidase [Brevibacillus borstelensis]|uniref:ImmA/IrrE family metallo-endopeptidase n=1 Tax=Brevibacillus borstelensis TaxID=45462 RepID=UPI00046A8884|nr:ImmA/IrrE family metallo-endopeptidase [Brevibacillus borstelensis]
MDLSLYKLTPVEQWITDKYLENCIFTPLDLDIDRIARMFGGEIVYMPTKSHARWEDDGTRDFLINLDSRLDEPDARGAFFHELCHPLRHIGNQAMLPKAFKDLQETQASLFQQYASIPFFMVQELELPSYEREIPYYWAHVFNVPVTLASRRYHQIKARIFREQSDLEFMSHQRSLYRKADPANWCDEAKEMFRLAIQRKKDKGVVFE